VAGDPAFAKTTPDPATVTPTPVPAQPGVVTLEAFQAFQQQHAAQMREFAGAVTKAISAVRAAPAAPPAPAAPSDVAQRLLENPDAVLNEKFQAWFQANVAPSMRLQMGDTAERLLNEERSRFDAEFGPGAFDKHVRPGFDRTLEQIGENRDVIRSNAQSVRSIVDAVKGQNFTPLLEARTAFEKSKADAANAQPDQPPYLVSHPFGPRPAKGELTPHEKTIVDRARVVAGDNFDDMPELLAIREAWAGGLGAAEPGNSHPGVSVDAVRGFMNTMNTAEVKK
jgi:hypothetical protein